MKTTNELKTECYIGLSEDIDGGFYSVYDINKLIDLLVDKACDWITKNIEDYADGYTHEVNYTTLCADFRKKMIEE